MSNIRLLADAALSRAASYIRIRETCAIIPPVGLQCIDFGGLLSRVRPSVIAMTALKHARFRYCRKRRIAATVIISIEEATVCKFVFIIICPPPPPLLYERIKIEYRDNIYDNTEIYALHLDVYKIIHSYKMFRMQTRERDDIFPHEMNKIYIFIMLKGPSFFEITSLVLELGSQKKSYLVDQSCRGKYGKK